MSGGGGMLTLFILCVCVCVCVYVCVYVSACTGHFVVVEVSHIIYA